VRIALRGLPSVCSIGGVELGSSFELSKPGRLGPVKEFLRRGGFGPIMSSCAMAMSSHRGSWISDRGAIENVTEDER
jgi:hypothetical protein